MPAANGEQSIFLAALELKNSAERAAYLKGACGDDAALLANVQGLLAAHEQGDSFLDNPPLAGPVTTDEPVLAERPGTVIGPYRLMEQIGEGGMGLVFVAEQQQPVRRKVALKVIKPGMDSARVIARFEAERQALAMMDHQNIAKVFDAGTTDTGRLYFVMELVHGIPITDYCDANHLTPRQRLELFIPVCQAIQHAHQKGVIHRDIKPSNVLVTMYDDKPVPKVIDFGVAKAVEQRLTEKTIYTQFGTLVGTFEYMSPEQAEMNAFGVDTRSDIYSLGVLLYELLTGTTPLERARLREAAYGEIVRLIREEEPPWPSVRLSTSGLLAKVAAARKTDPGKLSRLVSGELDWLVMKCLEKDRTRRYETASGLARDVERHLKDEPVEACPPTLGYRLKKYVQRNRGPVVAAALVLLALVAGSALSLWQAVRATRAEARAVTERDDKENAREDEARQRILAQTERDKAKTASERLRRALYLSRANLIQAAWEAHHVRRVLDLLEQQRPGPDDPDLRNFEWHYFDRLCHADRHTLNLGSNSAIREVMVFSAAGTPHCFAAATSEGDNHSQIKIMNVATGAEVFTVPEEWDSRMNNKLALSQDGERLMVLAGMGEGDKFWERKLAVWDAKTKQKVFSLWVNDMVIPALSPDGRRIAAVVPERPPLGNRRAQIKIWEVNGNKEPIEVETSQNLETLAFTSDGKQLVLLSGFPIHVTVVNPTTGKELRKQEFTAPRAQSMALSPDGTRLIVVANRQASVCDTATGKELASFLPSLGERYTVAFSSDGQRVALRPIHTASAGQIWDVPTGQLLKTLKGHTAGVVHLAFSADGSRLYSADSRGTLKEWDASTAAVPKRPGLDPIVMHSKDGSCQLVWQRGVAADIHIRDVVGKDLFTFTKHKATVVNAEVSADGRYAISEDEAGELKVWKTATGEVLLERKWERTSLAAFEPADQQLSLAAPQFKRSLFSANGRRLAAALPEGGVKVWELNNFREIFAKPDMTNRVQLSPDGQRLLLNHRKPQEKQLVQRSELKLWDVDADKHLYSCDFPDIVQLSPDGKRLALALTLQSKTPNVFASPYAVKVLDATTADELVTFEVDDAGPIRGAVVFSPDGNRLAVTGWSDVLVWDIPTGKRVLHLKGHVSVVDRLAFSPDGARLASITGDRFAFGGSDPPRNHELILWDLATGSELMRLAVGPPDWGMSFSSDGHRLAIGGDVADPRSLPESLDATPRAVAPAPKGKPP